MYVQQCWWNDESIDLENTKPNRTKLSKNLIGIVPFFFISFFPVQCKYVKKIVLNHFFFFSFFWEISKCFIFVYNDFQLTLFFLEKKKYCFSIFIAHLSYRQLLDEISTQLNRTLNFWALLFLLHAKYKFHSFFL